MQTVVMTRLSENISQASVQTSRRSAIVWNRCEEFDKRAAAIQVKVEECAKSVDVAVPMHSTAVKHFAATEIAADQARGHAFLLHGNAKGQARHAGHFSATVGSRTSSSDQHAKAVMRVAQAALYLHTQDENENSKTLDGCGEEGSQLPRGTSTGGAQDSTVTGSTRHVDRSINSNMSASRSAR